MDKSSGQPLEGGGLFGAGSSSQTRFAGEGAIPWCWCTTIPRGGGDPRDAVGAVERLRHEVARRVRLAVVRLAQGANAAFREANYSRCRLFLGLSAPLRVDAYALLPPAGARNESEPRARPPGRACLDLRPGAAPRNLRALPNFGAGLACGPHRLGSGPTRWARLPTTGWGAAGGPTFIGPSKLAKNIARLCRDRPYPIKPPRIPSEGGLNA